MTAQLTYDVVIATRNRPDALELSIPLMVDQDRKPASVWVVDSSDDAEAVRAVVAAAAARSDVPISYVPAPRGLTKQRNVGMTHVTAPVVFFPDDDALWYPGVASSIMDIYERDAVETIAAVAGAETTVPPPSFPRGEAYAMSRSATLRQRVQSARTAFETRHLPDPFTVLGHELGAAHTLPSWLAEHDAVPVAWMTGFRMTYRTEAVRRTGGFDEVLTDYALFEDVDMSYAVMHGGAVVASHRARVYHHQRPGGRVEGRDAGAVQILNRAYVLGKHAPPQSEAPRALRRYARYKCALYCGGMRHAGGRQRLRGAIAAVSHIDDVLAAPADQRRVVYERAVRVSSGTEPESGAETPPSADRARRNQENAR